MHPRALPVLRIMTVVLVFAIAAVIVLIVRHFVLDDKTPRTELERAVFAAEEAVRAAPESADARIKLAAAYLESGSISVAREQADNAVRLAPADPAAHYILGLVQAKQGDDDAAIATFNKAVEMEGQVAAFYQDVWAALALAYDRTGQLDESLEAMNRALDFGPENARLLVLRAGIYERSELWADALYDYYQALSFVPGLEAATEGVDRISTEHPEAVTEVRERFEVEIEASGSSSE